MAERAPACLITTDFPCEHSLTLCLLWELQWLKAHREIEITSPTAGGFVGKRRRGDDRETMLILRHFFVRVHTRGMHYQTIARPSNLQTNHTDPSSTKLIFLLLSIGPFSQCSILKLMLVLKDIKAGLNRTVRMLNLKMPIFFTTRFYITMQCLCRFFYYTVCDGKTSQMVKAWHS